MNKESFLQMLIGGSESTEQLKLQQRTQLEALMNKVQMHDDSKCYCRVALYLDQDISANEFMAAAVYHMASDHDDLNAAKLLEAFIIFKAALSNATDALLSRAGEDNDVGRPRTQEELENDRQALVQVRELRARVQAKHDLAAAVDAEIDVG